MKTVSLSLDDELAAALESFCAETGQDQSQVVTAIVRKYVEGEQRKRAFQDPALVELYRKLEVEDLALAEEGLEEYRAIVGQADKK